ncbi:MAG: phosphatidate cytidylyltransferase [Bacteroidia bacterium]
MNNFQQRAITGFFFVLVVVSAILFSKLSFSILFGVITLLGVREFYTLTQHMNLKAQNFMGVLASLVLYGVVGLQTQNVLSAKWLFLLLPIVFGIFILELYRKHQYPFANIAITLLGVVYVALPFALLQLIVLPNALLFVPTNLLGFFFILWANDTGAYLVGRKFGKTKLFERISPNKTWEGTLGGVVLALCVAGIQAHYFTHLTCTNWLIIAMIISITGSLGDLVESLLKRSIDVKDSGTLLPGHGGILDRFDGLLIALPFVYTYLVLFVYE